MASGRRFTTEPLEALLCRLREFLLDVRNGEDRRKYSDSAVSIRGYNLRNWQKTAPQHSASWEIPVAAKRPVVTKKKITGRKQASLRPTATPEVIVSPEESGSPPTSPAVFDPRLLLTKIDGGKSNHEYGANESVYAQGDAADSVFYIERGKIKLTEIGRAHV